MADVIDFIRYDTGDSSFGKNIEKAANMSTYCNGTLSGQAGRNQQVLDTMKGIIRSDDSMLLFNNQFVNPVGLHK